MPEKSKKPIIMTTRLVGLTTFFAFLIMAMVLLGFELLETETVDEKAREEVHQLLYHFSGELETNLEKQARVSTQITSLIETNPNLTEAEFDIYAQKIQEQDNGIVGMQLEPIGSDAYVFPNGNIEHHTKGVQEFVRIGKNEIVVVDDGLREKLEGNEILINRTPIRVSLKTKAGSNSRQQKTTIWGDLVLLLDIPTIIHEVGVLRERSPINVAVVFTLHDDKDYKIVFGDPEVISQHSSVVRLGIAGGDWELYGVDLSMNALIARQAAIRRGAEIFTLIFFTLFAWYALSRFQMRGLLNQTESARIGSERQFYHLIQEASADPIFVHDIDGKILEVNDRACCALGYSREELLTMSVLDFEISRSKLEGRKMLRKIELNTVTVLRSKHRRKDGSVFPAEVHLGAIDTLQGIRLIGVTRDITAQRNYENQLERLNADKNKFFSIIAHDLKGPLSGFLGLTEMLATDSESFSKDDLKCLGSEMNKSGRSLFKLLEDLLDWSQSQMGKITYQPEIFDIATVIKENISLQSTAANQKEIRLLFEDWGAYPVLADKDMLATVIRNLISNALKFTPRGGRVSILVKNRNDKIHVSFQDTGIGMNEEQINRLFKIDTANRRQGTEKEKGTGLGLLLCYELIAQNKGEIKIESKPDKGSTFTFTLPVG